MGAVGDRLTAALQPYLAQDSLHQNALATFLQAIGQMYEDVAKWADDGPDGETGWSVLVDIHRVPTSALPWLGQFVGAIVNERLGDADQRQQIMQVSGWARGSVAALRGAPAPYLTGNKTVVFRERDPAASASNPAYGLTVITYTNETPNQAAVLAALLAVKPAGIILRYVVLTGQDYQSLYVNHPSYANVYSTYTTYLGLMNDEPGT